MNEILSQLSIKVRLYSVAVVAVILLATITWYQHIKIQEMKGDWGSMINTLSERQELITELYTHLGYGGMIHNFKNYVLRGQTKYVERTALNFSKLRAAITTYRQLPNLSESEKEALTAITKTASEYENFVPVVTQLLSEGKNAEARDAIVKVSDGPAIAGLNSLSEELFAFKLSKKQEIFDQTDDNAFSVLALCIGLSSLLFLLIVVNGRAISRGIETVAYGIGEVSKHNDLSKVLTPKGKDEVSFLSRHFNALLSRVENLLIEVLGASVKVGSESTRVTESVNETAKGVRIQHKEIDQVATAMNEMSASFQEVANNTSEAATASDQAKTEIYEADRLMQSTMEVMQRLHGEVQHASASLDKLEDESSNITGVLEVINSIAEQTNLLALNAAIEAARAGEKGRGFAVVADEVRALAQRTRSSIEEIGSMITRLQTQVAEVVSVMKRSQAEANNGAEQTAIANDALRSVLALIDTISSMANQIATASEEQQHVTEEINRNITNISVVAEQTLENTEEAIQATVDIGERIASLRSAAAQFKSRNPAIEIEHAKFAHLAWASRVYSYLTGAGSLSREEAVSHKECAFGKWYYDQAASQYQAIPAMQAIEKPHADLHQAIRKIIDHKESGRHQEAEQHFHTLKELSHEVVQLLDNVGGQLQTQE